MTQLSPEQALSFWESSEPNPEFPKFDIPHADMVTKLAKDGAEIAEALTPADADLWHHATGVVTEAGELLAYDGDLENLIEELGDFEFYLAGVRASLELDYVPAQVAPGTHADTITLAYWAAELMDAVKKVAIYRQEPDLPRVVGILHNIEQCLEIIRREIGFPREFILYENMRKLNKRYPGFEYTDQRAADRADKG